MNTTQLLRTLYPMTKPQPAITYEVIGLAQAIGRLWRAMLWM